MQWKNSKQLWVFIYLNKLCLAWSFLQAHSSYFWRVEREHLRKDNFHSASKDGWLRKVWANWRQASSQYSRKNLTNINYLCTNHSGWHLSTRFYVVANSKLKSSYCLPTVSLLLLSIIQHAFVLSSPTFITQSCNLNHKASLSRIYSSVMSYTRKHLLVSYCLLQNHCYYSARTLLCNGMMLRPIDFLQSSVLQALCFHEMNWKFKSTCSLFYVLAFLDQRGQHKHDEIKIIHSLMMKVIDNLVYYNLKLPSP